MVKMMANTEVDICNMALGRIRAKSVGTLTENSIQAEKCRIFYPEARDTVLSLVDWPFNKKTITMALKEYVPSEWRYSYAYPVDCLRARYLLPSKGSLVDSYRTTGDQLSTYDSVTIPFDTELDSSGEQVIVTNQVESQLVYSVTIKDVRLFGQLVVEMISYRLAMDLAITLGGDAGQKYRDKCEGLYIKFKGDAESKYLNQSLPRQKQATPRAVSARMGRTRTNYSVGG